MSSLSFVSFSETIFNTAETRWYWSQYL